MKNLGLVLLTCTVTLSGCGGNGESETEPSQSLTAQPTAAPNTVLPSLPATPIPEAGSKEPGVPDMIVSTQTPTAVPGAEVTPPSITPITNTPTVVPQTQATIIPTRVATAVPTIVATDMPVPVTAAPSAAPTATPAPNQLPHALFSKTSVSVDSESLVLLDATDSYDADGDIVSYHWEQIDGPNVEIVNGTSAIASFRSPATQELMEMSFKLTVTDDESAVNARNLTISIHENPMAHALRTGDASFVDAEMLVGKVQDILQEKAQDCAHAMATIFPQGAAPVSIPSYRIETFTSQSLNNYPVHVAEVDGKARAYSWVGEKTDGPRYAVWGANFFAFKEGYNGIADLTEPYNTDSKDIVAGVFKWLLKAEQSADIFAEQRIILADRSYVASDVNAWFQDNNIDHQWIITSDSELLETGDYDLFIEEGSFNEYKTAVAQNKPVLIYDSWLFQGNDQNALAFFDLKWQWWNNGRTTVEATSDEMCQNFANVDALTRMMATINNNSTFDYNDEACKNNVGRVACNTSKISDASGETLSHAFTQGTSFLANVFETANTEKINVFDGQRDYLKAITLLADKYRETISYPMDKVTTPHQTFLQAQLADTAINYFRDNPAQASLGTFSSLVTDLLEEPGETKMFTHQPSSYNEWTSTGIYINPGRQVTITRLDDEPVQVLFKTNFLRRSTRVYNSNGYSRPLYLTSPDVSIDAGESMSFSTPYGGPVYVWTKGEESTGGPITIEVTNAQSTPLLQAFDQNSIQEFSDQMSASNKSWVDIKTPFAEIHSLKGHMEKAFDNHNPENQDYTATDVKDYIDELNHYLISNNYAYAGFADDSLPELNANVSAFCSDNHLDCTNEVIHRRPKKQHINSDVHAQCGGLCAGNPFDSGSPIAPLGWGENHEMGHNLQRGRLKIYGKRSNESSNNIFPIYTMVQWMQDHNLTVHPSWSRPAHKNAFNLLQAAIANQDEANTDHPLWVEDGIYSKAFERLSFFIQIAYANQSWDVWTKMYLIEREFTHALSDETLWMEKRQRLAFSDYSLDDAKEVSGNDFMAITLSMISGLDHTEYFNAWGIEVSEQA